MYDMVPSIGSAPLPQVYEAAQLALAQCSKIDECKDWSDKALAIASYARQSNDHALLNLAKRIRGRAVMRCGQLLAEIDAQGKRTDQLGRDAPTKLSQREVAEAAGLSKDQQVQAVRVANVPAELFEELIESENPPTVSALAEVGKKPRAVLDLGDRDPTDFNRAMHFKGMVADYARELAGWDVDDLVPRLVDEDRRRLRELIGGIDAIHHSVKERIGQ
jgi:hypothetical protein